MRKAILGYSSKTYHLVYLEFPGQYSNQNGSVVFDRAIPHCPRLKSHYARFCETKSEELVFALAHLVVSALAFVSTDIT
jgi:hypothetical protein